MFWTVHHLWPSGAIFLNLYRHWSSIFQINGNGTASFLHSSKGATKGYPFDMVAYGIGIIPLIKRLKAVFPNVIQTCYTDDVGELDMFTNVKLYFNLIKRFGLSRGYYLEPSKSVMIVHLDNLKYGKRFGLSHGFKVCTGMQYLGGFIRNDNSKHDWLKLRTKIWEQNIKIYSAVIHAIQLEWIFLQCITKNTGDAFAGM